MSGGTTSDTSAEHVDAMDIPEARSEETSVQEPSVMGSGIDEDSGDIPRGQSFTVNSRRLRQVHLQVVAEMLDLPTKASSDELRQLIEGRLDGLGREPRNVQIFLTQEESSFTIRLADGDGIFSSATKARGLSKDGQDQESEDLVNWKA